MKRVLIVVVGALLLLLALSAAAVVFLAATEGGTRFLAAQAERYLPIRLRDVTGALLREVRVGELVYELTDLRLEIDGLAASVEMMPLLFESHLIAHSVAADRVALIRTGEPSGDGPPPPLQLPFMPLRIDADALAVGRLELLELFPMQVFGSASWTGEGLFVHGVNVHSAVMVGVVEGRLGTGANPTIDAQVNWSLPDRAWGGEGLVQGRVDDFELRHVLRGYVSVDAVGRGNLSNVAEPYVDVQVAMDDLVLDQVAVRGVSGRLSGTLANATAEVDSQVEVSGVAPFAMSVVGYGPALGPITLRNVSADAMGGSLQAQGSVDWRDGIQVRLGGTADNVSLDSVGAGLAGGADGAGSDGAAGGLTGQIGGAFSVAYRDGPLALGLYDLSGRINGRAVGGRLEAALTEAGWTLEPLELTLGRNTLAGRARLADDLLLEADVQAPALEALDLGITGDAAGRVRLAGRWPDLDGSVELQSGRLEGFDVSLEQATVRASLTAGRLDGEVSAVRAARQQLELQQVRLAARGPLQDVDWEFAWSGGDAAGTFNQDDASIEVGLRRASLMLYGEQWSLADSTRLRLQGPRIELAPACVAGGGASACVQTFVYEAGDVTTSGQLVRAPVALLQPWLPVQLESGYLEGSWSLAGNVDDPSGELSLAARQLSYLADPEADAVVLPDLEAEGNVLDGALAVRLAATGEAFELAGEGALRPAGRDGVLSGTLRASASDLAALQVFDQRLEEVDGNVQGLLTLSGTPRAPRLEGRITLADGALRLNDPDIALSAVGVDVRLDDSGTFELRGSATQDGQPVRLEGSGAGLFRDALAFEASLSGERLQARHPDWEVAVSPDLTLSYADGRGRVRGKVEVPKAEVRLKTLPTSVPSPSEDVVVVGRDDADAATGGPVNAFRADVEVVLGKDVTLKALGITAELEGSLRARRDARGTTTLRGTVDVTGGEIVAQGQQLDIESGSVVYNGPVTRPYIDLRAVRVIEDVTPEVKVGLHIQGDADNLSSSVFSEPAMSETRALSFLVLGRDIEEQTADSDSSRLVAAAINLGLARSKGITSQLMRRTGLDELSAVAEAQNSFAIVAGKRVTDDIYVRYTYNTLSAVGAFLVRYDLTSKWQLEAQSGEQSAMDILYNIKK